jgi:hypothetical protein
LTFSGEIHDLSNKHREPMIFAIGPRLGAACLGLANAARAYQSCNQSISSDEYQRQKRTKWLK